MAATIHQDKDVDYLLDGRRERFGKEQAGTDERDSEGLAYVGTEISPIHVYNGILMGFVPVRQN